VSGHRFAATGGTDVTRGATERFGDWLEFTTNTVTIAPIRTTRAATNTNMRFRFHCK
jgi:hypothetical protein